MNKWWVVILLGMFINTNAFSASGSSGYRDIDTIRVGGGFLRVIATAPWGDPSSCDGNSSNASVLVYEGTPSYKELVSFVIAAKMSSKKIQFWINGCAMDSGRSYPNGRYVYIK